MNFELSDELKMIKSLVAKFVKNELMPYEKLVIERESNRGLSDDPILPKDIEKKLLDKAKDIGLWGIDVPEEFGGLNLGAMARVIATEELKKTIVPFDLPPEAPNLNYLLECCNEEQYDKYLIPYAKGEKTSRLALTEPGAGSDAAGIQMRAVKKGDKWVLNGTKIFITKAKHTDFIITLAVTDPENKKKGGITAFLVDRDTPGLSVPSSYPTIGELHPYEVVYDNVELGDEHILGEVGKAFIPLQNRLGIRRIEIAARCIGLAERCLEMMIEQANVRETFGKKLKERQTVQNWITDTYAEIKMTRLLVYETASKIDAGIKDVRMEASTAKWYATEMLQRVADRAIQLFGGMGLTKELPLEYIYRLARIYRIVEGPTEIHRWTVARRLLNKK